MSSMISSITVTYNPNKALLLRQILSLSAQVSQIIIVDNGSDNIKEIEEIASFAVENNFAVHLIRLGSNYGLGYAQNRGIQFAKDTGKTHVLILDQDSVCSADFIEQMLFAEEKLSSQNLKVGAIGPIYYNEVSGEIYPITKYFGPFIKRIKPTDSIEEATFLIASGCFIAISVLEDVGFMNEDLFIDYVDVEWSFRAKSKGYNLYANPMVSMSHTIGDSRTSVFGRTISVHSPLRRYYLYRNSIYMIKNRSIDIGYKVRELTFNVLRLLVFLSLAKDKKKYLKYSLMGFSDGLKGKFGKCPHQF